MSDPGQHQSDQWRKDPSNWVWGFFYFNKEDKRIFPPKRNDLMGFTINFANPTSVFALIVAFAFFGFVISNFN